MRAESCNRVTAFIVLGSLCAGAIPACAADKTISNKELGFEIKFPDGWTVTEKTPEGWAAKGVSRVADGAKTVAIVKVLVSDVGEGITAKALGESLHSELQKRLKNYELVEKVDTKVGEANACKVTYAYDGPNSQDRLQGVVYFVIAQKRGYQITTTANHADYAKYSREIEGIVGSFKAKAGD